MKSLSELATDFGTDKQFSAHNYISVYENLFSNLRVNKFLEIGFGSGASCRMWTEYFKDAEIYTIELASTEFEELWKSPKFDIPDLNVIIGDSTKKETWDNVPDGFDMILDDGEHSSKSQLATFELGFPKVRSKGFYIIEDLHCNFEIQYGKSFDLFNYFFNKIIEMQLPNVSSEGDFYKYKGYMPEITKDIFSYSFYKSLLILQKA